MKKTNFIIFFLFNLFIITCFTFQQNIYAQKFVQDSLIISFAENDSLKLKNISIDSVIDSREKQSQILSRYEKNFYLFIPVDLLILSKKTLTDEILNMVHSTHSHSKYHLAVNEFELNKITNSYLYPRYQLNTVLTLYKKNDQNQTEYMGQLIYESKYRKPFFHDKLKNGYENVIRKWQYELINDLSLIKKDDISQLHKLYNFRPKKYYGSNLNLITVFDVSIGTFGRIVDGQLFLANREAEKWLFRNGGYNIRYRTNKEFEAIEFGITSDYLFRRFHKNYLFRCNSNILFGLNRWKDVDKIDHKVYDAFLLEYSLSQTFTYNPLDKRSFLLGIGLLENLTYIYSKDLNFEIGVLLQLGIKL